MADFTLSLATCNVIVVTLSAEAALPPGACTYDSMVSRHGCMYTMLSDVLVKLFLNRLTALFKRMVAGVLQASIDLNFLYFMMATITCCGVAPIIAAVTWAKTTGWGACTGTPNPSPPFRVPLHLNSHIWSGNNSNCNRSDDDSCNRLHNYDCSIHLGP